MFRFVLVCLIALATLVWGQTNQPGRTLVLMASTTPVDPYYKNFYPQIRDFHIGYAKKVIEAGDNVLVFVDPSVASDFIGADKLPADVVMQEPMWDIWARDYSTVGINKNAMFTYRNKYLTQQMSTSIQQRYLAVLKQYCAAHVPFAPRLPILDGGNVVDNMQDTAILTRRTVADNPGATEASIGAELSSALNYSHIVWVPDGGDTTGHSDGMVSFLDTNQLAITGSLKDQPELWTQTKKDLQNQLPADLYQNMITLDSVYGDQNFSHQGVTFQSACGLHVNALFTKNNLFVPVFGQDPANQQYSQSVALDQKVLKQIRDKLTANQSTRQVHEVHAPNVVCRMGGSARCLSTAIEGPLADCMIKAARTASTLS